jgi:nitroreductase
LLQLLQRRHTSREFATSQIDAQTLSNLLWAAYGVNRPDGKRTAPSGHDWQYIDVYVTDSSGIYRYEAKKQQLVLSKSGDLRSKTGPQDFAATAPVSLIYVNDARKFPQGTPDEERLLFGATTAGAIVQNVYLFCAANNLNTGVRADIDRPVLHAAMGLAPEQRILLAQSVGAPPGAK